MSNFWSIYKNKEWLENFLLLSIGLFIACAFLFLISLFIRRFQNIYNQKLITEYSSIIDSILFPLLFNNKSVHHVIESNDYQTCSKHKKFQQTLLRSIIKLHITYSGDYNLKLEEFYLKSGLIKISFAKLKSHSWSSKCEGIRELSEMNVQEAFFEILKCIWHSQSTLKLEALIGIIRLRGLEGLTVLIDYNEPINDWIQLNMLYEINNANLTTVKNFSEFLKSKNESVVILGLRLIARFNQIENMDQVMEIQNSNASYRIKNQAIRTLAKLPSLSIYNRAKN